MEFELASNDVTVYHFSRYATGTPRAHSVRKSIIVFFKEIFTRVVQKYGEFYWIN